MRIVLKADPIRSDGRIGHGEIGLDDLCPAGKGGGAARAVILPGFLGGFIGAGEDDEAVTDGLPDAPAILHRIGNGDEGGLRRIFVRGHEHRTAFQ